MKNYNTSSFFLSNLNFRFTSDLVPIRPPLIVLRIESIFIKMYSFKAIVKKKAFADMITKRETNFINFSISTIEANKPRPSVIMLIINERLSNLFIS